MKTFLTTLASLLLCAASTLTASEPLFNQLPMPPSGFLTGEPDYYGLPGAKDFTSPAFRTASNATHTYVCGWSTRTESETYFDIFSWSYKTRDVRRLDGFITKLDPNGTVVWTKYMRDLAGGAGWLLKDIAVLGNQIYVCGNRDFEGGDARAFVAKLTDTGLDLVCNEYSHISGMAGTDVPKAATWGRSISVSTVNGAAQVVVGGEVLGQTMEVKERQKTNPSATARFDNLVLRCKHDTGNYTDAWVMRFDSDLNATWATTLGYHWSDDSFTSVASDNTGVIYAALKSSDADRYAQAVLSHVDDFRKTVAADGAATVINGGIYNDYDFYPGATTTVFKLDPSSSATPVKSYFQPTKQQSDENGTNNRVVDMAYLSGKLYVWGDWQGRLRPVSHLQEPSGGAPYSASAPGGGYTSDCFITRLDAGTLQSESWRVFQSAGDDRASELTLTADSIYLAGIAGGTLSHTAGLNGGTASSYSTESTARHLFWEKLSLADLSSSWHLIPTEGGGSSIPARQNLAGVGAVGSSVMIVGGWDGGGLTMGPSGAAKTLPDPPAPAGFVGYLTSAGVWKQGVTVEIISAYGVPKPARGFTSLTSGGTIAASVEPEVYVDAAGAVISPQDSGGINSRAVTRRICTGYQFRNSTVNGTANAVTFVANDDMQLTFNWRTEHAVEIESDLSGSDGLTSTAAGSPQPEVQKHWIPENGQLTAFVDGAASDPAVVGTRWISVGYEAGGCVAAASGVGDGEMVYWPAYQPRQQTPKITVGGPGRVTWRWRKQHSLRVAVNSTAASGAPRVYGDRLDPARQVRRGDRFEFEFDVPVEVNSFHARRGPGWTALPPDKFWIAYVNGSGQLVHHAYVQSSAVLADVINTLTVAPQGHYSTNWTFAGDRGGYFASPQLDLCEPVQVSYSGGTPPASVIRQGEGEFWFEPGTSVTAYAPASVNTGLSTLALKGYTNATGSVAPFSAAGVGSKTFVISAPSGITWDYARAIYPETVAVGRAVTFSGVTGVDATNANRVKAPSGGSVSIAPSGSSWADMQQWDQVAKKLYVLRPGKFTVEFENTAATADAAQNVIVEVNAVWPASDYTHILEAPPVNVDESPGDGAAFLRVAFTEGAGRVKDGLFSTTEPGRSVLVFSTRAGGAATGNLQQENLRVNVVESLRWRDAALARTPVTIGQPITSTDHEAAVGHNGYVLNDLAPVNAAVYDRNTQAGPIIPVNEEYPAFGRWASAERPDTAGGLIALFPLTETGESQRTTLEVVSGTRATLNSPYVATWANPGYFFWRSGPEHFRTDSPAIGNGITNRLSLAAWIKPRVFVDWGGIITKGVEQAPYTFTTTANGRLRFGANVFSPPGGSGGGFAAWDSTNAVPADQWTHAAVTYDGATIRFYINGVLDSAQAASLIFGTVDEPLVIGGDLPGGDETFDGRIRDVRVYDRPLGAGQVGALAGVAPAQPGSLPVAWYRVQDGIRWPWKANTYAPQWPASPNRIVTASRLGSEGMKAPVGAVQGYINATIPTTGSTWKRPAQDRASVTGATVPYGVISVLTPVASDIWTYSFTGTPLVFFYKGQFDPQKPLLNLVGSTKISTEAGPIYTYGWRAEAGSLYHVVFTTELPASPSGGVQIYVSDGGARVVDFQRSFTGPAFTAPGIYHQADPDALGYNPNEEHSLIAPSFLDPARSAAFALHNDFNRTAADANFTSRPYTLVQYTDNTDPANPVPRMAVYAVSEEDAAITDPRLPAFNQRYTYFYQNEAGQLLQPPYPAGIVIGPSSSPEETNGENVGGRVAYHEDKKGNPWVISGDTDPAEDIRAAFYYRMRADFWHPTAEQGDPVSLGLLTFGRPRNIFYNTIWPDKVGVIKAGETVTFSGGEYASDGIDTDLPLVALFRPTDAVSVVTPSGYGGAISPSGQEVAVAIDGVPGSVYLHFGKEGTGLVVVPGFGPSIARELVITSGGDEPPRDPATYLLQGSATAAPDAGTAWTTIAQGTVPAFTARVQARKVTFANTGSFLSYRITFPSLSNSGAANSMQIGEVQINGAPGSTTARGLPGAVAWQSGKLLFDSANESMSPTVLGTNYLARVFPALESRKVPLALTSLPDELKPASGNVIVEGLLWRFKKLPASLQKRVFFDAGNQTLAVRGYLNDKTLGDGDLLAAPGPQTILQPNVLTPADEAVITALSSAAAWSGAVSALGTLSRNPLGAPLTSSLGIGLAPADGGVAEATSFGPGLAVVTNPDLLNPSTESVLPEGYITVAENDDPALGEAPVAMHVMKISRVKYRGSIAVIAPENAFDEKLTLRHTADFGGDVGDLYFEWVYREEDGRDLNPPDIILPAAGTPTAADWTVFTGGGLAKSEIQLTGASAATLTDNLFYCRYRHKDSPASWSAWAGAANSREPKPSSPSAAEDAAYVAQLAPGWIKRVTNAVNIFDARITDFRNNNAPATYTSMIQQAGQRWEGPVAFNPQKDAVENFGLIELYQTVLDRGKDLSINTGPGTDGVNTALLNAANRIAGLYTLLGNDAMADAIDPTVGYTTVGGQYGNLAPTIHCFQNQTGTLLEEELGLLRGRGEVGARPGYNRLLWNFTNGQGEAAYALNYAISDLTNDGFINEVDARRLYPQGHGDAWGHYTMALKGYYDLAILPNFTWSARAEKFNLEGVVLDVDYLDERAFAKSAAARAQCGAQLVDLVYRQAYTENPNGQWQGYRDTNVNRAWGVMETAQRAGIAAFCDWLTACSLLKAEETDPAKTGIRKVDRNTVGELKLIAQQASAIQAKLDSADNGMNPAGLDPNVVPFDIDPVLTDRTNPNAATHFEQIYTRAAGSARNAVQAFNHASEAGLQLRRTAASTESLRQQTVDQDRAFRNQLIEYFGTPYEGMIGAGKAYPAGYSGPDLYLFMYLDQVSAGGDVLPQLDGDMVATTIVPGLRNLATDTNPFLPGATGVDALLKDTVSTYFPADTGLPATAQAPITLNLPRQATGYALVAPPDWGARRSPGAIQASLQDLIQAEWKLRTAIDAYEGTSDDFKLLLRKFEVKSGIAAEKIRLAYVAENTQDRWHNAATVAFSLSTGLDHVREVVSLLADGFHEAFPRSVGLATDATSPARAAVKLVHAAADSTLRAIMFPLQVTQYRAELEAEEAMVEMDQALLTEDLRSELVDILAEIQQLANDEGDLRVAVIGALEQMRAASDRVRTVTEKGLSIIDERTVFNQRVASTTTKQRYEDYTFRVFHTEALRKYQSSFDLAARHAYLAGKAYQFELNLPDNHAANATPLLAEMLRTRTLGEWDGASPVIGQGGIAEQLAILKTNFDTLKGQLGFNNPATEVNSFSLRTEMSRIGLSSRVNADWRTKLETFRVPDLWNYQYQNNGVNYGYVFRRYCRPFAPESAGAQPALVIPFTSQIAAGKNWFGLNLAGGDSTFNASNFSTKIRSAGIKFDGYNNTALSQTPQVYLVPVGMDRMFLPDSNTLADRSWNVVDQRIPVPLPISPSNLADPNWQPYTGSASGFFEEIRKFSSFRAYHDAGGWSNSEMLSTGRLVGRSAWNTQWVLIIPSASLLNEPADPDAGLDALIFGAPLPGFTNATAGTTNRDNVGVRDIRVLLQTYSISGN